MKNISILKNFWDGLNARERIFVGVGGAVVVLFLVYILLVKPLSDATSASERALIDEKARFERIVNLAAKANAAASSNIEPLETALPIREAATESSRMTGIAISRIQPGQNGNVSFWIDAATTRNMFDWLILLKEQHGKNVQKLSLQKNVGEETLRGQFEFGGESE